MMEPEIVKNRGLSRVSEKRVRNDWGTLGHWVGWTDLEILHNFPSGLNQKGARGTIDNQYSPQRGGVEVVDCRTAVEL